MLINTCNSRTQETEKEVLNYRQAGATYQDPVWLGRKEERERV